MYAYICMCTYAIYYVYKLVCILLTLSFCHSIELVCMLICILLSLSFCNSVCYQLLTMVPSMNLETVTDVASTQAMYPITTHPRNYNKRKIIRNFYTHKLLRNFVYSQGIELIESDLAIRTKGYYVAVRNKQKYVHMYKARAM